MDETSLKQYLADAPPTVVSLAIKSHWDALTNRQKLYAHYISRASFLGTRIALRQVSSESEAIYDLILSLYHARDGNWGQVQKEAGVSDPELTHFLEYAGQFLGNLGNYKAFGDSKFIPRCSPETIEALASVSEDAKKFLASTKVNGVGIYADLEKPGLMHLGFPDKGHLSAYYPASPHITEEEIKSIGKFLLQKNLEPENTRIHKLANGDFYVLIASGLCKPPVEDGELSPDKTWTLDGLLEDQRLTLKFGDHFEEMTKIALHIKKAGLHAANDMQRNMMDKYAESFVTGSLKAFKDSQRYWVQDLQPLVESNIGFIENYRDPIGLRAEWEGFGKACSILLTTSGALTAVVAMVNKERTAAFQKLVEAAPKFIPQLPWAQDYEKDQFVPPDFTSLEVLTFAGSGIPAGINIPNYDDIRQEIGFKNVSLGNVLNAKGPNEKIPFIRLEDLSLYKENRDEAFEVQVGIHELLGHGTGKLLQETSPNKYNFDIDNPPINPITKKPCKTWYKLSQTWSTVFGPISSSYEECRAECVAMALSCDFEILKIFGFGNGCVDMNSKAGDVLYASYLSMARAGIIALEYWDPKSQKWGQAHSQARFSILRTLLDVGDKFVTLDYSQPDLSDLTIKLDKNKILSHGRPAVEAYLQKLHIYKCTADLEAGKALYDRTTAVDEFWASKVREQALRNKQPRKVFVQANTFEKDGEVLLKEYEPTLEGMIQSHAEREV